MKTKSATEQIKELAKSREYRQLEFFVTLLEEGCPSFFLGRYKRFIKRLFRVLKRRIEKITKGLPSGKEKMDCYHMVCEFLPAFSRFYNLNL